MAEKFIKTKFALLYKTRVEWETDAWANYIPLKGETCYSEQSDQTAKVKVGDGINAYKDLSYMATSSIKFINVDEYGFDLDLRKYQEVAGSRLIDDVLNTATENIVVPVITAGAFHFVLTTYALEDPDNNVAKHFTCTSVAMDTTAATPVPYTEKFIFIYDSVNDKTLLYYATSKNDISREEFDSEIDRLDQEKASQAAVDTLIDILDEFTTVLEKHEANFKTLYSIINTEIALADGFNSTVLYSTSQNDYRIYIPDDYFDSIPHTTGVDTVTSKLRFYPLLQEFQENENDKVQWYKITVDGGTTSDYIALQKDTTTNRYYAEQEFTIANWDEVNSEWKSITKSVTDTHYPSLAIVLEWYDNSKILTGTYSKQISFSDWDHFYNNKDWYAVEHVQTVDAKSLAYNRSKELEIKGFRGATQGQIPAKDAEAGITWIDPVNPTQLNEAVQSAQLAASNSNNYATQSGNKAVEASSAAQEAWSAYDATKDLFWKGTMTEYNALTTIDPNKFYMILTKI